MSLSNEFSFVKSQFLLEISAQITNNVLFFEGKCVCVCVCVSLYINVFVIITIFTLSCFGLTFHRTAREKATRKMSCDFRFLGPFFFAFIE